MYYAILSAFLLFLAFPNFDLWLFGWIFIIPFLYGLRERSGRSAVVYGLIFGLHFAIMILYSISILTLPGFIIFVLYLSLFYGLFTWIISFIRDRTGIPLYLITPVVWVVMEEVMSWGYIAFTLMNVGLSQHLLLPVIQVASITGVGGVSFIIVFVGSLLYQALIERDWRLRLRYLGFAVSFVVLVYVFGSLSIPEVISPDEDEGDMTIGVVQGNIAQEIRWDATFRDIMLSRYISRSRVLTVKDDVDLIVWPETAIPFILQTSQDRFSEVSQFTDDNDVYLFSGVQRNAVVDGESRSFNSSVLFNPSGDIVSSYDKIHLVPFAETIPSLFKMDAMSELFAEASDFEPGEEEVIFDIGKGKFGVLICFESTFPDQSRSLVERGADFLIVITNDTWFGKTTMPFIHASASKFRAVENRVWVVRAANTGVSAFYDPAGRELMGTKIFTPQTLKGDIELKNSRTFYNRYGYLFPGVMITIFVVMLMISIRNQFIKKNSFEMRPLSDKI